MPTDPEMASPEYGDNVVKLTEISKIDPLCFDVTISALLIGLGAEKYIEIFKKHNIGQCTLMELSDEDLDKLGVDDPVIRNKIVEEVKNLPIYEENPFQKQSQDSASFNAIEIAEVLEDSAQHLYRIYLSVLANTLAVKKTSNIPDCLLHRDKYASDIALATISEINRSLNSMNVSLHTYQKKYIKEAECMSKKKIVVGAVGSTAIVILSVLFFRSLKQLL